MTDPFEELLDSEPMSRVNEITTGSQTAPTGAASSAPATAAPSSQQVREALSARRVCPFCGLQTPDQNEPCPRCRMDDTPGTRQATKVRIGPWYVLQARNPAAPGMKYSTLLQLISKGSILPQSVVRGPTTHQLWRFAAHVRGVSREFGLCYSCGGAIERTAAACTYCGRSQEPPTEPDLLLDSKNGASQPPPNAAPEPATSSAIVPVSVAAPVAETFSNRMRELSRQREKAEQDARNGGLATVQRSPRQPLARSDERQVSAMDLAAALQDDPNRFVGESRGWGLLKAAAILLILAGIAGAALLFVKPEYQVSTKNWFNQTWASIKSEANRAMASTPAQLPAHSRSVATAEPAPRSPSIMSPAKEPAMAQVAPEPAPAAQPASEPAESRVVAVPPPPAPVAEAPLAQGSPPDRTTAIATMRQLYSQAIDAERKEDYTAAMRFYEQIEKLPNDVWPTDLRIRMNIVRQQAAQSSAAQ